MVIFEKNYDKICSKYTLKRTKLHHLKKFSGHVPEPPNFVTCKIPNREKYSCPPPVKSWLRPCITLLRNYDYFPLRRLP